MSVAPILALAALLAFVVCHAILRWQTAVARLSRPREDQAARQASHVGNPPRLGGVAVLVALATGIALVGDAGHELSSAVLVSALPVVIAGLAEDLGRRVSPRGRFAAALVSAALAVTLAGAWVPRADLPVIDGLMRWPLVAMALTVVFSAVYCHAVNLIDGMNGLAASVAASSALGCAAIAFRAGEPQLMVLSLILAASVFGFLVMNFPIARIFMGDAGAYGIGHLLVWLAITLMWQARDVAVPAMLLVLFWPIADVLHTVLRRFAEGAPVMMPDRLHLHQKVRRMLDLVWFGYNQRGRSNPLTTLVLMPMFVTPVGAGVLLWNRPLAAWIAVGGFLLTFAAVHVLVSHVALRFRR